MRAKLIGLALAAGLLVAIPVTAWAHGEGSYFASDFINTPDTNHLRPGYWRICASGLYDGWPEPPVIAITGGTVAKDISLGLGLAEWLEGQVILLETQPRAQLAGQIQLTFLEETPRLPALCLGAIGGPDQVDKVTPILYLVGGKHDVSLPLLGKSYVTAGIGAIIGPVPTEVWANSDLLRGIFLGIEKIYQPKGWKRPLVFVIEKDAKHINLGLRYELFRGLHVSAALIAVEKSFEEGYLGIDLTACLCRV